MSPKNALLLAVSGELSDAARREIMAEVAQDPQLNADYHDLREQLELLGTLPIPEPSAQERREIPAAIKKSLHTALQQKEASRLLKRGRYAIGALAAVTLIALVGCWSGERARSTEQAGQVAALRASIQKIEAVTAPASVPLALTNVPAPTPSTVPTLAHVRDQESRDGMPWNTSEIDGESAPSAPPGS